MAVRIEDAGFEIRDMIAWLYGSGFPKSLDVSKAIDKAAGAKREVVGFDASKFRSNRVNRGLVNSAGGSGFHADNGATITAPATDAARQWQGWGTALKPAMEPVTVARKPLVGTVAENVLAHGTGAINVDGCRVNSGGTHSSAKSAGLGRGHGQHKGHGRYNGVGGVVIPPHPEGRWPANVIHDGSDEPVRLLGNAARFFYCAKAAKKDRGRGNNHPTVKPTDLMRYLVRLVTPPGGVVLDPFMGSGSTGKAAKLEGFGFIGIEREEQYIEIARARIDAARPVMGMLDV
jgi:site-specific DNA-methyltransferase (adenine-specific)